MTQIVGKIVDSGGVALAGELILTLDAPLIDTSTSPDQLYLAVSHTFSIAAGLLSGVNVVESQTKNVTYHFQINRYETQTTYWLADGTQYSGPFILHTDSNYYTGTFYDAATSQRLGKLDTQNPVNVLDFHAVVPNVTSVEFTLLIPTRISTDSLPTTIRQVAELLTSDADYVEALRGGPRFKGAYAATTYYQRDDSVTYGGSSWVYINADPISGQTPSLVNTNYWQILAQKGDAGGTGGNDAAYDPTGWNGAMDAPSRNAVRDIVEQLVKANQLTGYAGLNSPTFTGTPNSPTPSPSALGTEIANAAWVRSLFALTDSPTFTGNPAAQTQASTDESNKLATTLYVKNKLFQVAFCAQKTTDQVLSNGLNILNFNQELIDNKNAFNPTTSTFTSPDTGWYEFFLNARVERSGGTTISFFAGSVFIGSDEYRLWEISGTGVFVNGGGVQLYLSQGQTAQFGILISSDGTVTNKNTYTTTYFTRCSSKKLFW